MWVLIFLLAATPTFECTKADLERWAQCEQHRDHLETQLELTLDSEVELLLRLEVLQEELEAMEQGATSGPPEDSVWGYVAAVGVGVLAGAATTWAVLEVLR